MILMYFCEYVPFIHTNQFKWADPRDCVSFNYVSGMVLMYFCEYVVRRGIA